MSAPEKIWAIPAIGGGWEDDMGMWCKSSTGIAGQAEYIRADALAAYVAAEVAKLDKWLRHEDDCKFLDIAVCDCGLEHTFSQIGAKP